MAISLGGDGSLRVIGRWGNLTNGTILIWTNAVNAIQESVIGVSNGVGNNHHQRIMHAPNGANWYHRFRSAGATTSTQGGFFAGMEQEIGEWGMLAMIWEGTAQRIGYNYSPTHGQKTRTSATEVGAPSPLFDTFEIGDSNSGGTNEFTGLLAEAALWNVTLTAAELDMLFHKKLSPLLVRPENLILYFPLINDTRSRSADISLDDTVLPATPASEPYNWGEHPPITYPDRFSLARPSINFKPPSRKPRIAAVRGGARFSGLRPPTGSVRINRNSEHSNGLIMAYPAFSHWKDVVGMLDMSGYVGKNNPTGIPLEARDGTAIGAFGGYRGPETSANETGSGTHLRTHLENTPIHPLWERYQAGFDFTFCCTTKVIATGNEGLWVSYANGSSSKRFRIQGLTGENRITTNWVTASENLTFNLTTDDQKTLNEPLFICVSVRRGVEINTYVQGGKWSSNLALGFDEDITDGSYQQIHYGGSAARWNHLIWLDLRWYNRALSAAEAFSLYHPDTRWSLYEEPKTYVRVPPEFARVGKIIRAGPTFVDGSHAPR